MNPRIEALLPMSLSQLRGQLAAGHPIAPEALADAEYRGVALGMPALVERLTWKTFMKTFHLDPVLGLRGWNVRLEQTGIDGPIRHKQRRGERFTFGHYAVAPLPERRPRRIGPGLLLDYGQGHNAFLDGMSLLRDPLVALEAGSTELLLGWTWVALGPIQLPTPSYFVLERLGDLGHVADPPRAPRPRLDGD